MNKEFIDFVEQHQSDDTSRLLLAASRYEGIDVKAAVQQIEGKLSAKKKWPMLSLVPDFLFPPKLNREQSSSEVTARYKASVVGHVDRVADLTGGMGIDALLIAKANPQATVDYVERDPMLCQLMQHNCQALGIDNIAVHNADSIEWLLSQHAPFDLIMADPARRDSAGRKVVGFDQCSPDIIAVGDAIRQRCKRFVVKASPMMDIDDGIDKIGWVSSVHVVETGRECKELLFVCDQVTTQVTLHAVDVDLQADLLRVATLCRFVRQEEAAATPTYCTSIGRYIYEPSASVMKAAPYRLLCQLHSVHKLAPSTHLYTSDTFEPDFPGRCLEVVQPVKLTPKAVDAALGGSRAAVVSRNYPLSADSLRRHLRIPDGGGPLFLLATTLGRDKLGLICRPLA